MQIRFLFALIFVFDKRYVLKYVGQSRLRFVVKNICLTAYLFVLVLRCSLTIVVIQYLVNNNLNNIAFPTDNHPACHVQEVVEHLYNSGALICFLPPYSLDLNPLDEVFAKVKHYLQQNDSVLQAV